MTNEMRKIVRDMLKCNELNHVFINILCVDDQKDVNDYSDEEIIAEAKYQLSLYFENGTSNNHMLTGEYGAQDQRIAKKEMTQIKKFLSKSA